MIEFDIEHAMELGAVNGTVIIQGAVISQFYTVFTILTIITILYFKIDHLAEKKVSSKLNDLRVHKINNIYIKTNFGFNSKINIFINIIIIIKNKVYNSYDSYVAPLSYENRF